MSKETLSEPKQEKILIFSQLFTSFEFHTEMWAQWGGNNCNSYCPSLNKSH